MDTWALLVVAVQSTAQAVEQVVQVAASTDDPSPLRSMTLSAIAIVYVQKWMKRRPWFQRFIVAFPGANKYAHRVVAAAGALLTMAGVHYTFSGSVLGGATYTIQLPPLQQMISSLLHSSVDFGGIFGLQQVIYDATRQPPYPPTPPPPPNLAV